MPVPMDDVPRATPGMDFPEPPPAPLRTECAYRPQPGFWSALGMTVLLWVTITTPASFLAIVLLVLGFDADDLGRLLMPVATFSTLACSLLLAGLWFGRGLAAGLALRRPAWWHVVFGVLLVAPVAVVAQEAAAWAAEYLPSINAETYASFAESPWWLVLLAGCLVPGVGEEIFFRGILGRGLVARLGPVLGIAWCSTLFALIHLDPVQVFGVLVLGVALHLAFLASGSLLIPMGMHALNNALAFGLLRVGVLSDMDHVPPVLVGAALLALVPLVALFRSTRTRWRLPDGATWTPGYLTAESPPRSLEAVAEHGQPSLVWLAALVAAYGIFLFVFYAIF